MNFRAWQRGAIWFGLAAVILCGAARPAMGQKANKAIEEVKALDQQLIAAVNAKDVDELMAHYWNSPEFYELANDGSVIKGWEAAKKVYTALFEAAGSMQLGLRDCAHWAIGDGVLGNCAYEFQAKMKNGARLNEAGHVTGLRRKIDGKWLLVYEHDSLNAPAPPAANETLYKRLGGYDALAAVSDDFLGRLLHDAQLGKFFSGVSKAHAGRIRQHVVDFLCAATGGPCVYAGADMKSTHAGLGITNADWDRMAGLLLQTLDKFGVPDRERKEVLGALGGLKADIVEKP